MHGELTEKGDFDLNRFWPASEDDNFSFETLCLSQYIGFLNGVIYQEDHF